MWSVTPCLMAWPAVSLEAGPASLVIAGTLAIAYGVRNLNSVAIRLLSNLGSVTAGFALDCAPLGVMTAVPDSLAACQPGDGAGSLGITSTLAIPLRGAPNHSSVAGALARPGLCRISYLLIKPE